MAKRLRVLLVEDNERDGVLLRRELQSLPYELQLEQVHTRSALRDAFGRDWDIVVADYHLSDFTAIDALRMLADTGRDLPFLVLTDTASEEEAVEAMRVGARDCLRKGRLNRLCPAIERELAAVEQRRARRRGA